MTNQQEFDLQELEKQILDNSLYLVVYEDIHVIYPEKYQVRRSSTLKKRMTNSISIPFYPYHLFLLCETMGFVDVGVIHPSDLIRKLQEHGDTIRITEVKVSEVDNNHENKSKNNH